MDAYTYEKTKAISDIRHYEGPEEDNFNNGANWGRKKGRAEALKEVLPHIEKLHSFDMGYPQKFGEAKEIGETLIEKIKKELKD